MVAVRQSRFEPWRQGKTKRFVGCSNSGSRSGSSGSGANNATVEAPAQAGWFWIWSRSEREPFCLWLAAALSWARMSLRRASLAEGGCCETNITVKR